MYYHITFFRRFLRYTILITLIQRFLYREKRLKIENILHELTDKICQYDIFLTHLHKIYYHYPTTLYKESRMEGMMKVSYTVMCKNDVSKEVDLNNLLKNEKVMKAIKSEFATGIRNLALSTKEESIVYIKTQKEVFTFTASKNDFADLLELAEEDARKHKRLKKECDGVELVDIVTVD